MPPEQRTPSFVCNSQHGGSQRWEGNEGVTGPRRDLRGDGTSTGLAGGGDPNAHPTYLGGSHS